MTGEPRAVLLDTCAIIWVASGEKLKAGANERIIAAGVSEGIFVSPISAWEIGLLSRPKANRPFNFSPSPTAWFEQFVAGVGVRLAPLTPAIAIAASELPEPMHGDPADRLLIATARHMGVPIVTRDAKIAAYAQAGHVQLVPC